jgi:hypothetical protein
MDFSGQLDLRQRAAKARSAAQAAVSESREQLRQRIDQAKVDVDLAGKDARQQVDAAAADARSKWAQMKADAAAALDYASWTVDNARLAVLDAIDARAYAYVIDPHPARSPRGSPVDRSQRRSVPIRHAGPRRCRRPAGADGDAAVPSGRLLAAVPAGGLAYLLFRRRDH